MYRESAVGIIAANLKKIRTKRGISQTEAAENIGISRAKYSNWELGVSEPDALEMIEICRLFAVSSEYFSKGDTTFTIVDADTEFEINLKKYTPLGLKAICEYCKFIESNDEYTKR